MKAIGGVDLSVHNGEVDFAALKAAGIGFVILRCGYGSDHPGQQDGRFEENVRKAEAAGLPWGAYLYSYAVNAEGGRAEAAHLLRLLKGRRPAWGVWYDMEDSSTLGGDLAAAAEAFCSAVKQAGLYPGIYANLHWFRTVLTSPVFDRYDRWVAQYNDRCDFGRPYGIWQFTDRLEIGGKLFDGNLAYRDYPSLTGARREQEKKEDAAVSYEQFREYMKRYEKELAAKPADGWSESASALCRKEGILQGDGNGSFRPQSWVTRQEAAQIAANLFRRLTERG